MSDINLSALSTNGQGFSLTGYSAGCRTGNSVSSAGDINGDGYGDIIIGAPWVSFFGDVSVGGASYVVFGKASGFGDVILGTLNYAQSFLIIGENAGDISGWSVSGAGDVNRDGYADVIIGAPFATNKAGTSYVIFGKASGIRDINLSTLNAAQGFRILGENANDSSGGSVSGAGDVNGDGYADIIIGAPFATSNSGKSYIIFGKANGFRDINLSTLNPTQGFRILGENANDSSGISVSGAGDVNGDGYADIIIGAPFATSNSGKSYIIFGKANGFRDINLSTLNPTQGFIVLGDDHDRSGTSVSSAGDINSDGYDDVIIGAPQEFTSDAGKCYIIFGKAGGFSDIDLSTLSTTQGFRILGENSGDWIGTSVSNAGDINGDGFTDVIIGAPGDSDAGKSYIIFGKSGGFSDINLITLNAVQWFRILGENSGDESGYSVSGAGDVNGDGYADIIIGAPNATNVAGKSYVVFAMVLQVIANNMTTTYGTIPILTLNYRGFVNNEGPYHLTTQAIASTTATVTSSPGNYAITVSGAVSSHYYFVYVNGILTIDKAPLYITSSSLIMTYGETIPALVISYSGFVNSESPSSLITQAIVSTTATIGSDAGNYTTTVFGAESNNYAFIYTNGTLTINKAVLRVTADNITMLYQTSIPTLTKQYYGFVNGEDESSLKEPITKTNATVTSPPGIYPIMVSGGVSSNYDFNYVDGYLTIVKPSSPSLQDNKYVVPIISAVIGVVVGAVAIASISSIVGKCKSKGICCFKANYLNVQGDDDAGHEMAGLGPEAQDSLSYL